MEKGGKLGGSSLGNLGIWRENLVVGGKFTYFVDENEEVMENLIPFLGN